MKKLLFCLMTAYTLFSAYAASMIYTETLAYSPPICAKKDLSAVVRKSGYSALNDEDYEFIFRQTGLGKPAVQSLKSLDELYAYQESYYSEPDFECRVNSPVSFEERLCGSGVLLAPLEDGDILVTNASHVLSWRNGHAAIVIDAAQGKTLEAVVIGTNSKPQNVSKWSFYPNFAVLRLKNSDKAVRSEIANSALEYLNDVPYNVFIGFFPMKYSEISSVKGTQCAHLVWLAYAAHGFDIDSDGGLIVTPKDISESELFDIVQVYGR